MIIGQKPMLAKRGSNQQTGATIAQSAQIPLLEGQKEIWLAATLSEESSCAFNLTVKLDLSTNTEGNPGGRIDAAALEAGLRKLAERHEALRTRIDADGGYQMVDATAASELRRDDLSECDGDARATALQAIYDQAASTAMHLSDGPLFHPRLIKLGDSRLVVLMTVHHIICDGWSTGVLMRELAALYKSVTGSEREPDKPEHQLSDYVALENAPETQSARAAARDYWLQELAGKVPALRLPADRPRTKRSFRAERLDFCLDREIIRSLKDTGRRNGCTFFSTMLAAYAVLLNRLSRQTDIVIGISAAQQLAQNMPGLVSHAVSMLPLRLRIDPSQSFRNLLRQVRTTVLNAFDHQTCTYGELLPQLDLERVAGQPPLVSAVFNLDPSMASIDFGGLRCEVSSVPRRFEIFDWFFNVVETGETARCELTHNADAYSPASIRRRMEEFVVLLHELCARDDAPLGAMDIRSPEDRELVARSNRTDTAYAAAATIPALIGESLSRHADQCAIGNAGDALTFAELDRRSNRVAQALSARGVGPDVLVGLCCERSVEMVVGLLGILKAGGAYVPLDPDYPPERLSFMLEDAAVPVLLTQERLRPRLRAAGAELLCLDGGGFESYPDTAPAVSIDPDSLAYVIYTSGSTGRPKGAMNSHRAIVNRLQWMQQTFNLTPADAVLQKTPFSFDVSVWEFFWPLMSGARLVLARPGGHQDPAYLAESIERHGITVLHFVPSMLRLFLEQPDLRQRCRSVRRVICSGEALSHELQQRFFHCLDAELHNLYGPTEAAVDVTHWPCRRDSPETVVPIGWPIANTRIHILDEQRQPVPPGVEGELYIGGVQVGRGYLKRAALTAERFIADPFSDVPGARLYATGDLARWRDDGAIEYRGRRDQQVKIRGLRIELGEIEAALEALQGIKQAAVRVQQPQPDDQRLVAYYVTDDDAPRSDAELRDRLATTLPAYMLPQHFMHLPALPLSPNGKLDRNALPACNSSTEAGDEEPQSATETSVAAIWRELTGARVYRDSDFFAIGGHSLLAIRLVNRLREQMGTAIPLATIFEFPTLRDFSNALERHVSGVRTSNEPRTTIRV
jgi:amino acid adenylation domain-containing protein